MPWTSTRTIDDILIYVGQAPIDRERPALAYRGPFRVLAADGRPILGQVSLMPVDWSTVWEGDLQQEGLILHEIGHVLGIGSSRRWDALIGAPSSSNARADTYFFGAGARAAFNRVGGRAYQGNKVPVQNGGDDSHWRKSVFGDELMDAVMGARGAGPLSEVTLHALADLGYYQIDVSKRDPYTLPPAGKPVATGGRVLCGGAHMPPVAHMY